MCVYCSDYKEYHTDVTVRFVVSLSPEKMEEAQSAGIHKKFKLVSNISTNNMVGNLSISCIADLQTLISLIIRSFSIPMAV